MKTALKIFVFTFLVAGFVAGVAFLTIGAWPVSGFGVVEMGDLD